ncbi:MAG TPA: flagellar hook-basal body complex protein FliE [Chondromyces sp.]|nr:flagellar hook-basal body complex protein FliE [Chondromyces sp.]
MVVQQIGAVSPFIKVQSPENTTAVAPSESHKKFADFLKGSIDELNESLAVSDQMTDKLIRGENVDLHQVLIASQKASIGMQLTMEVRNKAVEAYQEMMRMQI